MAGRHMHSADGMTSHARLYDDLAMSHHKLRRGRVWCRTCGAAMRVDPAECLRYGWPKCCGQTMTIDSPSERKERP